MSVRGFQDKEVTDPRGAWTAPFLVRKGTPSRASIAQNGRFGPGMFGPRPGLVNLLASAGQVTGGYNWIAPNVNLLAYMDALVIKGLNLAGTPLTPYNLASSFIATPRAPSFTDLGPFLYMAAWTTTNAGAMACQIHDGTFTSGTPDVDLAFRGPLSITSSSATDAGAGFCTAGTHLLGFVFQSRTGFSGKPGPVTGSVFAPISITLAAGNRTIDLSITMNTPPDAGGSATMYIIMTRASDTANWFFVPNDQNSTSQAAVPPNATGWTLNFSISVADADLSSSADSANDQFLLLTASGSTPPFYPSVVKAFGLRMCYVAGAMVYISDVDDPQYIQPSLNFIEMLNKRIVATVFGYGQTLFLTGDKWTSATTDNGNSPVTWPQPYAISDEIGAPFPNCIETKTAGPYAWIAAEAGLYLFDYASFSEHPVSFFQNDIWARINWKYAFAIQIVDSVTELICKVAVPLDANTEPSAVLCFDYKNGLTYDTVDFSLDVYDVATFSALFKVKESATNRTETWVGPSAAGQIAHFDPTVDTDRGNAIHQIWRSGYVRQPGDAQSKTIRVGAADIWCHGSGTLLQTWGGLDEQTLVKPPNLILPASPGKELFSRTDLSPVENYTFQFETNAPGDWFELSGFRAYFRPWLYER